MGGRGGHSWSPLLLRSLGSLLQPCGQQVAMSGPGAQVRLEARRRAVAPGGRSRAWRGLVGGEGEGGQGQGQGCPAEGLGCWALGQAGQQQMFSPTVLETRI